MDAWTINTDFHERIIQCMWTYCRSWKLGVPVVPNSNRSSNSGRGWIGSVVLILLILVTAGVLAAWKLGSIHEAAVAAASHPEPMESITVAVAKSRDYQPSATSIGTVLALRSITLQNEIAGTVREVKLTPGQVVEAGDVLVALDVSVEEAELKAQQAQAALTETVLARYERAGQSQAVSLIEIDRARAERDVAVAQIARIKAIIDRKTIYAPFRARVGLADVHPGQYLNEGTDLTTLQGIEDPPATHVDFTAAQQVAAGLSGGDTVEVIVSSQSVPLEARIVAIDARVDQTTRNAMVRARMEGLQLPTPGASVRVRVPVGVSRTAVSVPVSALRRSPAGDHVFIIAPDKEGKPRAAIRPVKSGAMLGDEVLIIEGLQPDEQVAASGSFKLRPGVLVGISGS
jgi:membrane fusion protein, multidrug efflux system